MHAGDENQAAQVAHQISRLSIMFDRRQAKCDATKVRKFGIRIRFVTEGAKQLLHSQEMDFCSFELLAGKMPALHRYAEVSTRTPADLFFRSN